LEKDGPSEGIAANISDLSCAWALPGTDRLSNDRLAIGTDATKSAVGNAVVPLQSTTSGGGEVLFSTTGHLNGSNAIRAAGVAGVSVAAASRLEV
jgi:hypothetical protein